MSIPYAELELLAGAELCIRHNAFPGQDIVPEDQTEYQIFAKPMETIIVNK